MKRLGKRAISNVFGSVLFLILVLTVASILFITLYRFNFSVQEAFTVEEERLQERISLSRLTTQNVSGTVYVAAIYVNNTGSITSRMRAVYVNSILVCDPSDPILNPGDTYIDPGQTREVVLPTQQVVYEPTSKITVATERGIKSTEYEHMLHPSDEPSPPAGVKYYLGPLELNFTRFYYTECDADGSYDPSGDWKPGWRIEIGSGTIVWNITVTNVDDRNITLNQFSCFTLFPNESPSNRRAWYIEPPGGLNQSIASNETVNLVYIWKTPRTKQMNPQSIYTTVCRNKVFLTFFGIFHEKDGTTKPYGQTIPFEAVLCVPPPLTITASPTVLVDPTMASTITASIDDSGIPLANANVSFMTTLGTLSAPWALTDIDGTAAVTLFYSGSPGTATVTATWQGLTESTNVIMNAVPDADFTETTHTAYTGELIDFNASDSYDSDGTIVSYDWDFGDGQSGAGAIVSHAYTDNGTYPVTLTVTDDRGATDSATEIKTVLNRAPIASFTMNGSSSETIDISVGEIIHFNASASYDPDGNIEVFYWVFGDGDDGTGMTVDHLYGATGTYIVTLTVTDDDGAITLDTKTVNVGLGP